MFQSVFKEYQHNQKIEVDISNDDFMAMREPHPFEEQMNDMLADLREENDETSDETPLATEEE